MTDELTRARPVIDGLNQAIRENPLAAGLIGAGVAWMLLGAKGFGTVAGAVGGAATKAASATASAGGAVADAVTNAGAGVVSAVKQAAPDLSVASIVPDISAPDTEKTWNIIADAGGALKDRVNAGAAAGRQYGSVLQSRLSESFERQPLLLGAVGLALGAGIAATFATTDAETEWLGQAGTAVRDKVREVAKDVTDRAEKVASEVQDEAARQGLTLDAAKDAASRITAKAKAVAGAGQEAFAQGLKRNPQSAN